MTLKCNTCDLDYNEFNTSGIKCPDCYITFNAFIVPSLKAMHGGETHTGKVPEKFEKNREPRPLGKQISRAKRIGGGIEKFVRGG